MTIEEMLVNAKEYAEAASAVTSTGDAIQCAATASAFAALAQAMDYHRFVEQWMALSSPTTVYNDPTEAADAAIYDANIAQWRKEQEQA